MPLIRVSLRSGKSADYKATLVDTVYTSLRETFDVPEGDLFALVHEHAAADFLYSPDYLGIARSDELIVIQLTVSNTRSQAQKKALYRAIADGLARRLGVRPEDVFITLVPATREDWSFGNGIAQYVAQPQAA